LTRGVIATPHHLASEAGAQVLRDGGNAIDAAIAADAVLCVVYPHMTSVGGDLMAIVWPAGAPAPIGLIGAGRSGELASIEAVRGRGHEVMPERGVLTVTVPGTVEAWGRLIERYGTFGLGPVLEPAAAMAGDGYIITALLSDALKDAAGMLGRERAAQELYPPMDGGMLLRNPDLAAVLTDIGRHGINGFYRGDIGHAIADAIRRRDGFVTARDLSSPSCEWVEPVRFKINCIHQSHARICVEHTFRDKVVDLIFRLIADPGVDLLTDGLILVDEICQANTCAIVQRNGIEKTLKERIRFFSPDRIGDVELERRFLIRCGFATFGKLKVERVESGMKLILRKEVQGLRHL